MAGIIHGLTSAGKLPSGAKQDLAADIGAEGSAIRVALDAAGLGQGAASDAEIAALVQDSGSSTHSAVTALTSGSVRSSQVGRLVAVPEGDPLPVLSDGDLVVRYFVPGSSFFTDFSADTVGSMPSGWSLQWKSMTSAVVASDAAATGGKVLSLESTTAERFGIAWDAPSADADRADFEVLFRSKMVGAGSSLPTGVGRASGAQLAETAYRGGGRALANRTVSKYVGGAYTDLGSDAFTMTADTWYLTRFRVNGSTIQVKVWADGAAEPASWLSATDTSITDPGWVGLALTSNGGVRHVDWVAVGTGGRTAVAQ